MLTRRQRDCHAFIADYITRNGGISPSFQEIMDGLGLVSKSGVHRLVGALAERGFIWYRRNRARSINLVSFPASSGCPLFRVAA